MDNHGNTLRKMIYCIKMLYHHGEKHFLRVCSLYPETSPRGKTKVIKSLTQLSVLQAHGDDHFSLLYQ